VRLRFTSMQPLAEGASRPVFRIRMRPHETMRHATELRRSAHIAARKRAHYEQRTHSFWKGTRDHDVSQNLAALLMPRPPRVDLQWMGSTHFQTRGLAIVSTACT